MPEPRRLAPEAGEGGVQPVVIVLLLGVAIIAGANVYTFLELKNFRLDITEQITSHEERLALLDGNVNRFSTELETQVGEVRSRVDSTEQQIEESARKVESRVLSRAETIEKELEATRESSEAQISAVGGKLEELEETTNTQAAALGGRVDTVKLEVDANTKKLEETIADLTSVRGDLGVQSGLIATNADELNALKQLGERNYYEFDLGKTRKAQRVGPVSIRLTGTDRGKNRYSIELWADDKKIVKRRKTLLEPVQFYVQGARAPFELVVNKIDREVIGGYLATPKITRGGG